MNTNFKCIDFSISADRAFKRMLHGAEHDMSHMKPPAFSSIALSLYFTSSLHFPFAYVAVPLY